MPGTQCAIQQAVADVTTQLNDVRLEGRDDAVKSNRGKQGKYAKKNSAVVSIGLLG